jgi:hypothetical protein
MFFLVAVELGYTMLCFVLFFTVFVDRPHLRVRRKAAIGALGLILALGAAGDLLPFEGHKGERCHPALATYGARTDALLTFGEEFDDCTTSGELLVMFGWLSLLGVVFVSGIWWWSGDS